MDFFVTNTKGVYVINHDGPVWTVRNGNKLYFFNNHNKTQYTKDLINITLSSSEHDSEIESRLLELTKLQRFDFLLVRNYPESSHIGGISMIGSKDLYERASRIALCHVTDGKAEYPSPDRSFTIKDEDTRKVLARLPKITPEVMNALLTAGVIRSWEYYEYPWADKFTFTQPKGSPLPEDLRTYS